MEGMKCLHKSKEIRDWVWPDGVPFMRCPICVEEGLRDELKRLHSSAVEVDIVFDGPPGPEGARFVEVESRGRSFPLGKWVEREDGHWVIRFTAIIR